MKQVSRIRVKAKKVLTKPNRGELITVDNPSRSQSKQFHPEALTHTQEEWEELEEGGSPLRKPNGDKNLPPDKLEREEEEQEGEDSDHTITVSDSTSGEGVRIVKRDGTELSLKQLLKLIGRSKRRWRRHARRRGKGGGGGDSPSSSGGSEEDSNESDLEIRGLRGKRGHRGQRGRTGPQGPVGPPIHILMPPAQPVPMTVPAKDANITISNDGMERSLRTLSDSLTQMFTHQASLIQTLHSYLTQGIQAQGDQALALQQLAFSSHQREYDRLFNAIPYLRWGRSIEMRGMD